MFSHEHLYVCDLKFGIYLVGLNMPTLEGGSYLLLDKGVINMTIASEAMVTLQFCAPPFEQKCAMLERKASPRDNFQWDTPPQSFLREALSLNRYGQKS